MGWQVDFVGEVLYLLRSKLKKEVNVMPTFMKNIWLEFLDWRRQWFQTVTLIMVIFLPSILGVQNILFKIFWEDKIDIASEVGDLGAGLIFAMLYLWAIRQWNREEVLNCSGIYHKHSYMGYCFCSGILGYKKCNLRLVPIYLQFKLVINGVFAEYIYNEGIRETPKNEKEAEVHCENNSSYTQKINLILIDTYTIEKGQLPADVLNLTSIYVKRYGSKNNHVRYLSEKFVKKVLNTVRQLPEIVTEINIFATLNPSNCYNIAKEVFSTGGRDHIKHLWVYQQDGESPRHFTKKMKIF